MCCACVDYFCDAWQRRHHVVSEVHRDLQRLRQQLQQHRTQWVQCTQSQAVLFKRLQDCEQQRDQQTQAHAEERDEWKREHDNIVVALTVQHNEALHSGQELENDVTRKLSALQEVHDQEMEKWQQQMQSSVSLSLRLAMSLCSLQEAMTSQLLERDRLHNAYNLANGFVHGYSILLNDLKMLTYCIKDPKLLMDVDVCCVSHGIQSVTIRKWRLRTIVWVVRAGLRMIRLGKERKTRINFFRAEPWDDLQRCLVEQLRSMEPLEILSMTMNFQERKKNKELSLVRQIESLSLATEVLGLPSLDQLSTLSSQDIVQRLSQTQHQRQERSQSSCSSDRITSKSGVVGVLVSTASTIRYVHGLFGQNEVNELHKYLIESNKVKDNLFIQNEKLQVGIVFVY
jgi:hypothetical protein